MYGKKRKSLSGVTHAEATEPDEWEARPSPPIPSSPPLLSALCSLLSAPCSLLPALCSLLSAVCSLLSFVCCLLSSVY
jgi:hypothetical protein